MSDRKDIDHIAKNILGWELNEECCWKAQREGTDKYWVRPDSCCEDYDCWDPYTDLDYAWDLIEALSDKYNLKIPRRKYV